MLLLKRPKEDYWCHIAGKIENSETAIDTVVREVKEEIGLGVKEIFSADYITKFFNTATNELFLVPVFFIFAPQNFSVILDKEHTDYKWCSLIEAKRLVAFKNQQLTYDYVWDLLSKGEFNENLFNRFKFYAFK